MIVFLLTVVLCSAVILLVSIKFANYSLAGYTPKPVYWELTDAGFLIAKKSFSLLPETYGYDVEKGSIGAFIPPGTLLPPKTSKFWICHDSKIGNGCVFGSDVYIDHFCSMSNTRILDNVHVKRSSNIHNTTIEENCVIGVSCTITESFIAKNTYLTHDVKLSLCSVAEHSSIAGYTTAHNSSILDNVTIDSNCKITDSYIGSGCYIAPYTVMNDCNVPAKLRLRNTCGDPTEHVLGNVFIYISGEGGAACIHQLDDVYYITINGNTFSLSNCDFSQFPRMEPVLTQWRARLIKSSKLL